MRNYKEISAQNEDENEMSLDLWIISIRAKTIELSDFTVSSMPTECIKAAGTNQNNNNGPEEAGCMVLA